MWESKNKLNIYTHFLSHMHHDKRFVYANAEDVSSNKRQIKNWKKKEFSRCAAVPYSLYRLSKCGNGDEGWKFHFQFRHLFCCMHIRIRENGESEREKHIGGVADDACATMSVCRVALLTPYMCNVNDEWHITLARLHTQTHTDIHTERD